MTEHDTTEPTVAEGGLTAEQAAEAQTLFDAVAARIDEYDYTSFAELGRLFPEHFSRGNLEAYMTKFRNIVIWPGLSPIGLEVTLRLLKARPIEASSLLVYLCDGSFPKYPIVRRPRDYKTPHWLPIVFRRKR